MRDNARNRANTTTERIIIKIILKREGKECLTVRSFGPFSLWPWGVHIGFLYLSTPSRGVRAMLSVLSVHTNDGDFATVFLRVLLVAASDKIRSVKEEEQEGENSEGVTGPVATFVPPTTLPGARPVGSAVEEEEKRSTDFSFRVSFFFSSNGCGRPPPRSFRASSFVCSIPRSWGKTISFDRFSSPLPLGSVDRVIESVANFTPPLGGSRAKGMGPSRADGEWLSRVDRCSPALSLDTGAVMVVLVSGGGFKATDPCVEEFLEDVEEVVDDRCEVKGRVMEISGGRMGRPVTEADMDDFSLSFSTPMEVRMVGCLWVEVREGVWPEDIPVGTMVGILPPNAVVEEPNDNGTAEVREEAGKAFSLAGLHVGLEEGRREALNALRTTEEVIETFLSRLDASTLITPLPSRTFRFMSFRLEFASPPVISAPQPPSTPLW